MRTRQMSWREFKSMKLNLVLLPQLFVCHCKTAGT